MPRPAALALEFARRPVPGRVKTRLAATEGPAEAARIYRLLAGDVHATLRAAQDAGALDVAVCLPDEDIDAPRGAGEAWLPGARHRWPQGPGDLGARLAACFVRAFARGYRRVLAVGTDVVGVRAEVIGQALEGLQAHDVVLAPTPDGGYGLIGLRADGDAALREELFRSMPWGTHAVAGETRRRAAGGGARLALLGGLWDVDVEADLAGVLPRLAVLVPVLDEAPRLTAHLPALLAQAAACPEEVEVVVADGGSADGSAGLARRLGARVVGAPRGRGTQLRAAAAAARARWLWTLHADTRIAPDALETVLAWCRRRPFDWGACPSRFADRAPFLRLMECLTDGRPRVFRLPYGDQGLLVKRSAYEAVGGYPPIPLMEDVALARALARFPGPGRVPTALAVDARRWRRHGMLGATLRNLWTLFRWRALGTDPAVLAAGYGGRGTTRDRADTLAP